MTSSRSLPPFARASLGVLGIAGGLGLLAAFAVDIPPGLNTWRIVLFNAGAIAIALASFERHAAVSRRMAVTSTLPLIVANAGYLAWILVAATSGSGASSGALALVGFWLGLAMWLADAWFGLVALRLGRLWRLAALALAIGSLLAITGMDRLGLTSGANPTVFGPISLVGIALNGMAWVLLGLQLAGARDETPAQVPSRA